MRLWGVCAREAGGGGERGEGSSRTSPASDVTNQEFIPDVLTSPQPPTFLYGQSQSNSFITCPASKYKLRDDRAEISPGKTQSK